MDKGQLIIILASLLGVVGLGGLVFLFFRGTGREATGISSLMGTEPDYLKRDTEIQRNRSAKTELEVEAILRRTGTAKATKYKDDLATKLYRAGYFLERDRKFFKRMQILAPVIAVPFFTSAFIFLFHSPLFTGFAVIFGLFVGYAWPMTWLERQMRRREEDLMYYLPLVIEQVSIGVSSSLDVGPCLAQIVQMANDRGSHNSVTELFVQVEKLIRSGLNLEDALIEVGDANGITEVKHAFMFLAQCAKHGGEISRQLQELADSTMTQRQVQVEGRITSLPVKATGPLATVFAGFFALLFAGLLIRLMSAFNGG